MPDQFCSRLFDILRQNFAALPTIFCWAMLRFTDILLEFCSALLRFVGTLPDAMASTRRSVYIRVRVVDLNGIHGAYPQSATGRSAPSPTPRRKARTVQYVAKKNGFDSSIRVHTRTRRRSKRYTWCVPSIRDRKIGSVANAPS